LFIKHLVSKKDPGRLRFIVVVDTATATHRGGGVLVVRHPEAEAAAGLRELPAQALDRRASTGPKHWRVKRKTPHKPSALGRGLCDVFVVCRAAAFGYL
jgi:hypothetical protein